MMKVSWNESSWYSQGPKTLGPWRPAPLRLRPASSFHMSCDDCHCVDHSCSIPLFDVSFLPVPLVPAALAIALAPELIMEYSKLNFNNDIKEKKTGHVSVQNKFEGWAEVTFCLFLQWRWLREKCLPSPAWSRLYQERTLFWPQLRPTCYRVFASPQVWAEGRRVQEDHFAPQ